MAVAIFTVLKLTSLLVFSSQEDQSQDQICEVEGLETHRTHYYHDHGQLESATQRSASHVKRGPIRCLAITVVIEIRKWRALDKKSGRNEWRNMMHLSDFFAVRGTEFPL